MIKGHVPRGVRVQVPPRPPLLSGKQPSLKTRFFCVYYGRTTPQAFTQETEATVLIFHQPKQLVGLQLQRIVTGDGAIAQAVLEKMRQTFRAQITHVHRLP